MTTPVVLITGALAGIGRATAIAFAETGAKVVVSGRRPEAGAALVRELEAKGAEAAFIQADVRSEDDVKALVEGAIARFGRLDIAVNNAGVEGVPAQIADETVENYTATFDTNVKGVLLSMKHELKAMKAQGSGSIVNISSTYGHTAGPGAGVYIATKHAVEGLTKTAALEGGEAGIRVNAVAPGPIQTDMLDRFTGGEEGKAYFAAQLPLKRIGRAEEVARAIVFVASDAASYMTGHILDVDGGATIG